MPLGFLKNNRFLGARIEAVENTAETMTYVDAGTHDGRFRLVAPRWGIVPVQNARDIARPAFEPLPHIVGGHVIEISFGIEMAAHTQQAPTEPEWSKLLRACGFGRRVLRTLTPGTISNGPFEHGEQITQATTGAVGTVFLETSNGATTMYFNETSSTAFSGSNVVTGSRSGATCTPSAYGAAQASAVVQGWQRCTYPTYALTLSASSAPLAVGSTITGGTSGAKGELMYCSLIATSTIAYVRMLTPTVFTAGGEALSGPGGWTGTSTASAAADAPSLTLDFYMDGRHVMARGCRGNVDLAFTANQQAMMSFTFRGPEAATSGSPTYFDDAVNPTCKDYKTRLPPVFRSSALNLSGAATALLYNTLRLASGNNVVVRPSAEDAEGYAAAQILESRATMTINPDAAAASVYDWHTKLRAGTPINLRATLGTTALQKFDVAVTAAVIESITDSERDPVYVNEINAYCSSGQYGTGVTHEGQNNAFALLNY